ncbi:flagellin [Puniceibacterium sp. IMCC21224]|uniref:flagellin n=1 Tax=Puniceibacterium sp. IMCC21224 TaxID=1618204 RepID=UPI00064E0824|nr:flagellin [Puniceibacterium sp. IMCC21224]KMK65389.1 flagellin/flagellar hook associated protein [Puniceibacterium sp. IMCC21224]
MQSIGDMAQALVLRHRQAVVREQIDTLGVELTTGEVRDKAGHLGGDLNALSSIDKSLFALESYRVATTEATYITDVMQGALGTIQDKTESLSIQLIQANLLVPESMRNTLANEATATLDTVLLNLNTSAAGRTVFGGTATDRSVVTDVNRLLTDLRAAVAGQTDLTGITATLDTWFDAPGGGYETSGYQGASTGLSPFQLSSTESASLEIRADDQVFRDTLKGLALAALSADAGLAVSSEVRGEMLMESGKQLMAAQNPLTELRAGLGALQGRIEETTTRNSSEKTSMQIARLQMVGADVYETASRLENAQLQLESIYTVTVRASRLSLVEFLR